MVIAYFNIIIFLIVSINKFYFSKGKRKFEDDRIVNNFNRGMAKVKNFYVVM